MLRKEGLREQWEMLWDEKEQQNNLEWLVGLRRKWEGESWPRHLTSSRSCLWHTGRLWGVFVDISTDSQVVFSYYNSCFSSKYVQWTYFGENVLWMLTVPFSSVPFAQAICIISYSVHVVCANICTSTCQVVTWRWLLIWPEISPRNIPLHKISIIFQEFFLKGGKRGPFLLMP